jgi:hypothetical protein
LAAADELPLFMSRIARRGLEQTDALRARGIDVEAHEQIIIRVFYVNVCTLKKISRSHRESQAMIMVWTNDDRAPTDDEVRTGTGLRRSEWMALLDRWDGDKAHLRPLVSYLVQRHHVHRTWAQVIALCYLLERT